VLPPPAPVSSSAPGALLPWSPAVARPPTAAAAADGATSSRVASPHRGGGGDAGSGKKGYGLCSTWPIRTMRPKPLHPYVCGPHVSVGSRVLKVLGHGGGEGRFPSLMAAAVESEASESYIFSFIFDVSSMGNSA